MYLTDQRDTDRHPQREPERERKNEKILYIVYIYTIYI